MLTQRDLPRPTPEEIEKKKKAALEAPWQILTTKDVKGPSQAELEAATKAAKHRPFRIIKAGNVTAPGFPTKPPAAFTRPTAPIKPANPPAPEGIPKGRPGRPKKVKPEGE